MLRSFAIMSVAFWFLASTAVGASELDSGAMIFLPPGASYCRDFRKLEPMQKYDQGTLQIPQGEAENYFTYRGIEEWVRGFVTAANIIGAKNKTSGDATAGKDLYELMPQLFDYCRSHRNAVFSDAAQQLLSGLQTSKNQ
jgi:hypothetical protein